jgi:chorismate mutase/prephenate dehydratase
MICKGQADGRSPADRPLDGQLLELLNQRAQYAQQVGEIKARHGEAGFIYRPGA